MDCSSCSRPISTPEAAIAILVMGDEYTYSYFACRACGKWTVESYLDRFLGEDSASVLGPFPKEIGEKAVALIRSCPCPLDKNCDCPSHQALYHGVPR